MGITKVFKTRILPTIRFISKQQKPPNDGGRKCERSGRDSNPRPHA